MNFLSPEPLGSGVEAAWTRRGPRRLRGPVVKALGSHAVAPGSNPVLTSGLDLFPVSTALCN